MMNCNAPLVGIRGGGDLASGIAHRLFKAGFPIIITELANPRMVRRSVCFGEAVWEGKVEIEGVEARLIHSEVELEDVKRHRYIGILIDPEGQIFDKLPVQFLVDARMLKRNVADQRRQGRLVIGVGPGFCVGENVDLVIETMRGHTLGQVIYQGSALPDPEFQELLLAKVSVVFSKRLVVAFFKLKLSLEKWLLKMRL